MIKGLSKVSGEIRRGQIVQAALKIIAVRGVSGLTTAAIAKEVGISEANLYRHFKNKDEILRETVKTIGEGILRNIGLVSEMTTASAPEKLNRLLMLQLDYIEKNEGIPKLIFSEEIHVGNKELKEILLRTIGFYASRLEAIVREGQKAGLIKKGIEPAVITTAIIGIIQVTTLRWSLSGFSFSLVDEGLRVWNNFQKCLRP